MNIRWRNFIWDYEKERSNICRHGVSFREAAWSTEDPRSISGPDEVHSGGEPREWLIGHSPKKRLLLVIYTRRESGLMRIISAWKAGKEDQTYYDEENS